MKLWGVDSTKIKLATFVLATLLAAPSHASLIHHYSFDVDASDSAGSANGTLINGASVSGGALQLDGVDDFAQFDLHIVPTFGSYTVAMFYQQNTSQDTFVELISQGTTGGLGFFIGHAPTMSFG